MLKVAICDDNEEFINKIEIYLHRFADENSIKVKINHFFSGQELMATFIRKKYDLIFLDIKMPEMDGFETAERIRKKMMKLALYFVVLFIVFLMYKSVLKLERKIF